MSSEREMLSKHIDKQFAKLKKEIMYFHDKDIEYAQDLTNWLLEVGTKNKIIHSFKNDSSKKDKEMARRRRGQVFWIDYGMNIGSELNYDRFCVVIKEFTYHALVVPISSVKEENQSWKSIDNLFIDIGKIKDLPSGMDSYAVVSQMKAVSKQRLSDYRLGPGKFLKLKLDDDQLDLIDAAILSLATK